MSFFSMSSSSSSPPVVQDIDAQLLGMRALPSGLLQLRSQKSKKIKQQLGKPIGDKIVSTTYNMVATRPIARRVIGSTTMFAELRLHTAGFTTSTIATVFSGSGFALNDFASRSEYTGLFDQYRIAEFEAWYEPDVSQSTAIASLGSFASTVDLDDATAPSSYATVEGKQSAVLTVGGDAHYHRWKPHMAVAVYSGAFTSFGNAEPMWIDVASPSVQHYGLKTAHSATSVAIIYALSIRALIEFRQAGI